MIKIQNLSKSYNTGNATTTIVDNLNISIPKGKTIAITGTSGSGKSTFLSLLAGFESCDSGEIVINNHTITSMSENKLVDFRAKNLGFVFQNFYLLPYLNVLENVCIPLDILGYNSKQVKKEAISLLKQVGLGEIIHMLPTKISGGECQRVAICRAIIAKPKLIFADEPTGNLDFKNTDIICDLLFSLVKNYNITMIIVTHNLELAKKCDKSYFLNRGKLE